MSWTAEARALRLDGRLAATDLALRSGEITCLIGPNGSGKTSLLHALAGIGKPAGQVRLDGVDPWQVPPPRRGRLLAFLPTSRDVAWPLVARDYVALGLGGEDRDGRVDAALARLGAGHLADRRLDLLSTGERSRAMIARALVAEPRLLLLDEPTANLDPLWQLKLMEDLRALAGIEDRAVVVALHDLDMAARYADRLIVLRAGRIVADGHAGEVLAEPGIVETFGVERGPDGWRPATLRPQEDPRSSP